MPAPGGPPLGMPPFGTPPKKGKPGLLVGLAVVGLGLVIFLITGLLAPGFLRTDKSVPAPSSRKPESVGFKTAKPFVDRTFALARSGQFDELRKSFCNGEPKDPEDLTYAQRIVAARPQLRMEQPVAPDDTGAAGQLSGSVYGKKIKEGFLSAAPDGRGGTQCLTSFEVTPALPPVGDAVPVAKQFVKKIDSGDRSVLSKMCPDGAHENRKVVAGIVDTKPKLRIGKAKASIDDNIDVKLTGKWGGSRVDPDSAITVQSKDVGKSWCIHNVFLGS